MVSAFREMHHTHGLKSFGNRFEITNRRLGTGGSGCVLMAIDRWKSRQVACKIINLEGSLPKLSSLFSRKPVD